MEAPNAKFMNDMDLNGDSPYDSLKHNPPPFSK